MSQSNKNAENKNDKIWWFITIACFVSGGMWWAGLGLMFLNINGKLPPLSKKKRTEREDRFRQQVQENRSEPVRQAKAAKKKSNTGLAAIISGGVIGGIGALALISTFWDIVQDLLWGIWDASWIPYYAEDSFFGLLFLVVGAVVAGIGLSKRRKERLFERYQALITGHNAVSIHAMADALGIKYEKACKHLQEMIDDGLLPASAWIDRNKSRLMLDGSGFAYEEPTPEPEPTPEQTISEEEKILRQIRADNDLIDNEEISRKIDRIEELTRRIFAYIREKPSKAGELRSFLNYYLPQTLKILETYARLEAQDVEGENIKAAKQRIEGVMDKLVESYERQLDKLFEGDVIDITTDIEVMETMLARDGLTADILTKK